MMGCSTGDTKCYDDEKPQHRVTITKGFWMGQTVVTVDAWKRYRIAAGTTALPTQGFGGKTYNEAGDGNMPAVMMTWEEAKSYCEWAAMRLPTEAEWEYAARAGATAARYGDLDAIAWYSGNSGHSLHGVGLKQPNAWKLYDMLGNVWQWTADWYHAGYHARSESEDPLGPRGGQSRVVRGGSWNNNPQNVRLSNRDWGRPAKRVSLFGCRCVGELP
jgi:formylglycine-generating enzyme required for sulfatase activity